MAKKMTMKLTSEQKHKVRELIYHYCEIQKTVDSINGSAVDVCMRETWISIINIEELLGLIGRRLNNE